MQTKKVAIRRQIHANARSPAVSLLWVFSHEVNLKDAISCSVLDYDLIQTGESKNSLRKETVNRGFSATEENQDSLDFRELCHSVKDKWTGKDMDKDKMNIWKVQHCGRGFLENTFKNSKFQTFLLRPSVLCFLPRHGAQEWSGCRLLAISRSKQRFFTLCANSKAAAVWPKYFDLSEHLKLRNFH